MFIFVSQELARKLIESEHVQHLLEDLKEKKVDLQHIIRRLKEAFGLSRRGKICCLYKLEIEQEYPFALYSTVYRFWNYEQHIDSLQSFHTFHENSCVGDVDKN
jgi:hypothetical protein